MERWRELNKEKEELSIHNKGSGHLKTLAQNPNLFEFKCLKLFFSLLYLYIKHVMAAHSDSQQNLQSNGLSRVLTFFSSSLFKSFDRLTWTGTYTLLLDNKPDQSTYKSTLIIISQSFFSHFIFPSRLKKKQYCCFSNCNDVRVFKSFIKTEQQILSNGCWLQFYCSFFRLY